MMGYVTWHDIFTDIVFGFGFLYIIGIVQVIILCIARRKAAKGK